MTDPIIEHSPWLSQAKEHWKKYCLKLYQELEQSGQLHQRAVRAVEQTEEDLENAIENGMSYHEAWELVRERYIFLPADDDPRYPYK